MLGCPQKVQIEKSEITEHDMPKEKESHAKVQNGWLCLRKKVPSQSLRSLRAEAQGKIDKG